jgi:hypothetical protein
MLKLHVILTEISLFMLKLHVILTEKIFFSMQNLF